MKANILITGIPGTGKTTLSEEVAKATGMDYISLNEFAESINGFDGYDEENECKILDDERVIEELDERIKQGNCLVEYHTCDVFPENWFHAIFVLRTSNDILYKRLQSRGYSQKKLMDNLHLEITEYTIDEARELFPENIVHELRNDDMDNFQDNVERIKTFVLEHQQVEAPDAAV